MSIEAKDLTIFQHDYLQNDEFAQKCVRLLNTARDVKNLAQLHQESEPTVNQGFGSTNVLYEAESDEGNWFVQQWKGEEPSYYKETYRCFYSPDSAVPLLLEGATIPICKIGFSVVIVKDDVSRINNRFFTLTLFSRQEADELTISHSYSLSIDVPASVKTVKQNEYSHPLVKNLNIDQAQEVLDYLSNTFHVDNTQITPELE